MTQLEDCYFCGTVEESLDSYPVIPAEAYPPEDVQRTVVLCPTCREKLGRVLDPIVEHLGASETGTLGGHGSEITTGSDDDQAVGRDSESERDDPDERDDSDVAAGHDDGTDHDGDADESIEGAHADEAAGEQRAGGGFGDEEMEEDARTDVSGDDDREEDESGTARADPVALPEGTEDVVRLLRNREFPVERGDIVTVATNAYGLRREECDAAIDALIERGWLIERGGELHRTE